MKIETIVKPAQMPVSLEEFRRHLWNIYDNHNSEELLTELLQGATDNAEERVGRKLINRTMRITAKLPLCDARLILPYGGCQQINQLEVYDGAGIWQVLPMEELATTELGAFTVVKTGNIDGEEVRVTWVTGYGEDPQDVPGDIRMAIKQLASHWYNNRAAAVQEGETGRVVCTPLTYTNLLHTHRLYLTG